MKQIICSIIICFISLLNIKAQETPRIRISIGTTSFVATTYENATTKAFIALLPLTVTMNEMNGNEKYNYLSGSLPNSPANPSTINTGDLMLYGSNCIVLFYETLSTSYSYTQIASIDNPSGLKTALGSGNPTVIFELVGNTSGIEYKEQNKVEFEISHDGLLRYTGNAKRISLIDMNGRIIASSTSNVLDVNNYLKGIYILKIEKQNQTETIKIKI